MILDPLETRRLFAVIALFNDPAIIVGNDTVADSARNMQAVLEAAGHTVRTIDSAMSFALNPAAALAGADVFLLPKLYFGDIRPSLLLNGGMDVLRSFVENGGALISAGDGTAGGSVYNSATLNDLFGWDIGFQFYTPFEATPITLDPAAAAGTAFAGGPASLTRNDDLNMMNVGYPGEAQFIYRFAGGQPAVARIPVSNGVVVSLGWDYRDAAPRGTQDGGWNDVLIRAVEDAVAEPFAVLDGGTLKLTGTNGADTITVYTSSGFVNAVRGQVARSFEEESVSRVEIDAGDGNDRVDCTSLTSAPAYIFGGIGNDELSGGIRPDTITGGAGKDTIRGSDGDDRLNGAGGHDKLYGETGNDRLYGGAGDDVLDGGGNVDRLWGDDGADTLIGGGSNDKLYGGTGDDLLNGGKGIDFFDGGAGRDTASREQQDYPSVSIEVLA
ncbi:MAG: calcium-binding protein [Tepidisphaeraceae bacterium]